MGEMQQYGHFKRQTSEISHEKTWTCQRKGNLKRETGSLLKAAQNKAIRIMSKQELTRCNKIVDVDDIVTETKRSINECNKLSQKEYKTRHDWVRKMIHYELCKKFKFDHTNNWYVHNPEFVLENQTLKILWHFEIQTDNRISARRPDLEIVNKKMNVSNSELYHSG